MKINTSSRTAQERSAGILPRNRISDGRLNTREYNPIPNGKGLGINLLFLTDFEKLARGRRGFGNLTLQGAKRILDDAIPRLAKRWKKGASPGIQLVDWVRRHLPEVLEAHDENWIEARRQEVRGWTSHAFHDVDFLAKWHRITQDEVEGFGLCSLVSFERPQQVRLRDEREYDRQYSQRRRAQNSNHVPRDQSLKARWRRQEFGNLTWEQLRYRIRKGLVNPDRVNEAASHFSSGTGVTVNRTDEKCEIVKPSPDATAADNGTVWPIGGSLSLRRVFIRLPQPRPTCDDDRGEHVPVRAG